MKTYVVVLIKNDSLLFLHENISCGTHQKCLASYFSMKTYTCILGYLLEALGFLFLHENICYVLMPSRSTSNEYHNIYFPGEIRTNINIFGLKNMSYIDLYVWSIFLDYCQTL